MLPGGRVRRLALDDWHPHRRHASRSKTRTPNQSSPPIAAVFSHRSLLVRRGHSFINNHLTMLAPLWTDARAVEAGSRQQARHGLGERCRSLLWDVVARPRKKPMSVRAGEVRAVIGRHRTADTV